jgi:protocatechuate 3,4-dioxygenase beta subunit
MTRDERKAMQRLTRRDALTIVIGTGATLAFGCGDDDTPANNAGSGGVGGKSASGSGGGGGVPAAGSGGKSAAGSGGKSGAACDQTPGGEIGPYFSDDSDTDFKRSNIVANLDGSNPQAGIPLTLKVTVIDTEQSCAPYASSQVDIWHCNAAGIYSDQSAENTTTETWLRGYQITDDAGQVTFTTVIPGWYEGRTTHIHLRVRSSYGDASSTSDSSNTTQLFFDQDLVDSLATSVAPYSAEHKNSTTNASDHVFSGETNGANVLSLTGDNTNGYTTEITISLPITDSGSSSTGMGGPGMGGPPGGLGGRGAGGRGGA